MRIGTLVRALLLTGLAAASEMSSAAEAFAEKVFVESVRILLKPFPTAVDVEGKGEPAR